MFSNSRVHPALASTCKIIGLSPRDNQGILRLPSLGSSSGDLNSSHAVEFCKILHSVLVLRSLKENCSLYRISIGF